MIQFDTAIQDNILVLSLSGSLDAITYDEATAHFNTLTNEGHSNLVLNLAKLEYVSSAGVRVLLGAIKNARRTGGDLRLADVSGQVFDTLEIAGITSIVKYYDGVDVAVASYKN
ncbi:MAG: STAS domain-containing protein [Chloroflexota bacterium]